MAEYDRITLDPFGATNFGAELISHPLELVYKRVNGRYEPWVVVGTSALLASLGISGRGVYAARNFRGPSDRGLVRRRGDVVGSYGEGASVIARGDDAHVKERGSFWVERGRDKLLIVEDGNDYVLLDGDISPIDSNSGSVSPPWGLINDCRNTGRHGARSALFPLLALTRLMLPHALLTLHVSLSSLTGTAGDGARVTGALYGIWAAISARIGTGSVPHGPIGTDILFLTMVRSPLHSLHVHAHSAHEMPPSHALPRPNHAPTLY
jgi:hypothetical protein